MKKSISKRQVNNPFTQIEGYNCFGCSPKNDFGLHLEFYEEGDEIVCEWQPKAQFQTPFLSPVLIAFSKINTALLLLL